jgi:hypothetical protein
VEDANLRDEERRRRYTDLPSEAAVLLPTLAKSQAWTVGHVPVGL